MISIKDIHFDYSETEGLISGINLSIDTGERVGIIGPNGAGKTTLFHLVCGLIEASKGSITINKKTVIPGSFNPDIGFIFQNPNDQLFNATVFDDIAFGPANMKLSKKEVLERVEEALKITGCSDFRNRSPHHLSGGERRMAAIASVLSMKPELLIFDEPTSNLDFRVRRRLIDFITQSDKTIFISSHDLEFILETCTRVIILDQGTIIADGIPAEVMYDAKFMMKHGLERPHSLLHGKTHRHNKS